MAFAAVVALSNEVSCAQPKITLKLVRTFGDTGKAWIAEASDIAVGPRGIVYVADRLMQTVDVFDKSGKLVKRFGKRGKGPGEFENPSYVACHEGMIAVGDFPFPRIQVFDKDFKLLSTIYSSSSLAGVRFDKRGYLLLDGVKGLTATVYEYSIVGGTKMVNEISAVGIKHTGSAQKDLWYNVLWLATSPSTNDWVLASSAQNKVEIFSASGKLFKDFSVLGLPDEVKFKTIGGGITVPDAVIFSRVAFGKRDNVFLLVQYSSYDNKNIYVMSRNGNYLTKVPLPERSKILYIDSDNNLYVTASHAEVVKKYKMIYTGF